MALYEERRNGRLNYGVVNLSASLQGVNLEENAERKKGRYGEKLNGVGKDRKTENIIKMY